MDQTPYYFFTLPPDPWRKKPCRSTWRMTIEEAAERYPGAEPILDSVEWRENGGTPITGDAPYAKRQR